MKKTKKLLSVFMVMVMIMPLVPGNIVNATELDTVNEISTEAATETTETVTTEEVTTEAVTSGEYTSEEVTTEITTETLDEIKTETPTEQTTEEVTEDTEEDTEEETTEEVTPMETSLLGELESLDNNEDNDELLRATSHKACASCQANLTLTMHTNNSSWYQAIVNNRGTAATHALNDGYSGACASFVSYLLIDAGISGVTATPSCDNLYSQLKNGAAGYKEIGAGMTPVAGVVNLNLQAGDIVFFGPGEHVMMVGQPSDSPGFYSSSLNGGNSYLCYPGKVAANVANEGVGELEYYLENKSCYGSGHANLNKSGPMYIFRKSTIPPAYTLQFLKQSANPDCTNGNPLYSFAGAEYTLKKTDGTFAKIILGKDGDNYIYGDTSTTPLITDADGNLTYTFTYVGAGSNIIGMYASTIQSGNTYTITFSNGMKMLEGSYKLQETKASPGYMIDDNCAADSGASHPFSLSASNSTATITCSEPPIMDPVKLVMIKKDAETGEENPVGQGSLEGAVFEVAYYDGYYSKAELSGRSAKAKWYFKTDSNYRWDYVESPLYNDSTYVSSADIIDSNIGKRALPLGTFKVTEVKAPDGYLTTSDADWKGSIDVNGNHYPDTDYVMYQIKMDSTNTKTECYLDGTTLLDERIQTITNEAYDQPIRGNLKLTKLKADASATIVGNSGEPMANIAFVMESMTTGEKHIVVTDENGQVDTSGSSRKNVNGNDRYLDALTSDKVYNNELRPTSIWFFGTADENAWDYTTISRDRGCLPYDTYTITELASKGNDGTQLIRRGQIKFSISDNSIKELDVVNMPPQTIATKSLDDSTLTQNTYAGKNCSITDTLTYDYFEGNKTYTLKGILVAREDCSCVSGKSYKAGEPILDDYGKYITINKTFTSAPSRTGLIYDSKGTVKLQYSFDAEKLAGVKAVWQTFLSEGADNTPLVVKEGQIKLEESNLVSYTKDGELRYVTDGDLSNKNEWVNFKSGYEVHTTALSEDTKDHMASAYPEAKIIDTVAMAGLNNNRTYKLVGTLMDKATGEPLDIGGKTLTVQNDTFSATASEMTKDVIFEFDATYIAGKSAVIYETLYVKALDEHGKETEEWIEVAKHQDIDDEGQTVHFSDIHTTAMGKDTESHEVKASKSVTIVDEVTYSNLIVGKEYTVKGILMLVPDGDEHITDKDKVTEAGIYVDQNGYECHPLVIDGNTVTSEVTFTATQPDGVVPMEFTFDARKLAKKSVVVFEDVYYNGIKVGTHADITDEDQTITVKPKDTSLAIRVKSIIDGRGGVITGDVAIIGIILMMLSALFLACVLFYKRHKREVCAFFYYKKKPIKMKNLLMLAIITGILVICGRSVQASDNIDPKRACEMCDVELDKFMEYARENNIELPVKQEYKKYRQ